MNAQGQNHTITHSNLYTNLLSNSNKYDILINGHIIQLLLKL